MSSVNITDEEKEKLKSGQNDTDHNADEASTRPFLDTVLSALDCSENDYLALLSLCLTYALAHNKGMNQSTFHCNNDNINILVFMCYCCCLS